MSPRRAFSVSVFARHDRALLLVFHKRLGTWLPAGGEIEPGETPLEAARRELAEETGLEGTFTPIEGAIDGAPPGLLGYEEHAAGAKGQHLNFAFVADVARRDVRANDEIERVRWVRDPAELPCPRNVEELGRLALFGGGSALAALGRAWLDAFNARDLDRLLTLYADDAIHTSPKLRDRRPETKGEIAGKPALRAWWQDAMERLPGLRYDERAISVGPDRVMVEYERTVPGEAPLAVAEVFVVDRGRIVRSHVFHG